MRLALSVAGLLVVAYLVMNMAKRQAEVLVPRASPSAASAAAASASKPVPHQVQQDVQKLLDQGAQRASEAAP
jgi:hypothetical protein